MSDVFINETQNSQTFEHLTYGPPPPSPSNKQPYHHSSSSDHNFLVTPASLSLPGKLVLKDLCLAILSIILKYPPHSDVYGPIPHFIPALMLYLFSSITLTTIEHTIVLFNYMLPAICRFHGFLPVSGTFPE